MFLIFDTETSGLPNPKISVTSPEYPHVMQLACLLLDLNWKEVASLKTLVKVPEHVEINKGAFEAHGLTKEKCNRYGVDPAAAFHMFISFVNASQVQVAHNIDFDHKMMQSMEKGLFNSNEFILGKPFCTMLFMTPLCKIPHKHLNGRFKWPKLQEAYYYCFKKHYEKAHDAMADVRATGEIYQYIVQHNLLKDENIVSHSCE